MPLWTDAYLGDTRHLSTFEHGAYLLLLIVAWRSPDGALPDDDRLLARYAGCSRNQWARISPVIRGFFQVRDGQLLQSRLIDERNAVKRKRESQSANGRASALKNKERHATKRLNGGDEASTPLPLPLPLPITVDKSTGGKPPDPVKELFDLGVAILVEAGVDERQARSFVGKLRKTKTDAEVMQALLECRAKAISEPIEWLTKRLAQTQWVSASGYEYRGDLDAVMREAEKRADWTTYYAAKHEKEGAHAH